MTEYIFKVALKYFHIEKNSEITNIDKSVERDIKRIITEGEGKGLIYKGKEILDDDILFAYVKKTWFGNLIMRISKLYALLKCKEWKRFNHFDILLGISNNNYDNEKDISYVELLERSLYGGPEFYS